MYKVFGLWLGPNFGVRSATDKQFYFRLMVEKMHAFAVFTKKYLRLYGSGDTNFTTAPNYGYPKIEIHDVAIEIQNH